MLYSIYIYIHSYNFALNHGEAIAFLRRRMHARIQTPRVWNNIQDMSF